MRTPGGCRRSRSVMRGSCEGCKWSAPVLRPSVRANGAREMRARWQAPRSSPDTVIPGWSAGPDLRCAIAHRGISRFRVRCFASPRNDGVWVASSIRRNEYNGFDFQTAVVCRGHNFTSSPRNAPEALMNLSPKEGVGNAGRPMHPRPRVHLVVVERTRVTTSTPESPGIPARNGFNGFLRALPGDRALLPPSPCGLKVLSSPVEPNEPPQDLTPASRRQDHTTSPSASSAVVLHAANRSRRAIRPALASHAQHCCVHRTPPRVRDDHDTPLVWDETAVVIEVIWVGAEQQNFLLWDSTAAITPNLARRAVDFFTRRHSASRRKTRI